MSYKLQYKQYEGSVLYSSEDRLLHGRILEIRDLVTYDGIDVRSIETNFRGAVKEYLAFCKAEGKTPEAPKDGVLKIRCSAQLGLDVLAYAEQNDQSISSLVSHALEAYLAKQDL